MTKSRIITFLCHVQDRNSNHGEPNNVLIGIGIP